jgi:hypothetical protein
VKYIPRMDEFSYLSVLISVILGLAVTQILKGFREILLSRARIRIYWARDRLGGLAAAGLRPELVGDVRVAPVSAMDLLPHLRSFCCKRS